MSVDAYPLVCQGIFICFFFHSTRLWLCECFWFWLTKCFPHFENKLIHIVTKNKFPVLNHFSGKYQGSKTICDLTPYPYLILLPHHIHPEITPSLKRNYPSCNFKINNVKTSCPDIPKNLEPLSSPYQNFVPPTCAMLCKQHHVLCRLVVYKKEIEISNYENVNGYLLIPETEWEKYRERRHLCPSEQG